MEKQSQEAGNSSTEPPSQSLPPSEESGLVVPDIQNGQDNGLSLTLLDGATSQIPTINPELKTQKKIREALANRPLINWHSIDSDHALEDIRATNGWAEDASDKSLLFDSNMIRRREGFNVLSASIAGLVALLEQHKKNDRYVVIVTGRKT